MSRAPQERSPNQRLREMIAACGMSYDAVARAVIRVAAENGEVRRTNRSAAAHWYGYDAAKVLGGLIHEYERAA